MTTLLLSQSATGTQGSAELSKSKASKKRRIPEYLTKMNAMNTAMNNKIIKRMQTQVNYLRNPRFKVDRPPITFTDVIKWYPSSRLKF